MYLYLIILRRSEISAQCNVIENNKINYESEYIYNINRYTKFKLKGSKPKKQKQQQMKTYAFCKK